MRGAFPQPDRRWLALLLPTALLLLPAVSPFPRLTFLGQTTLPTGLRFGVTEVGGISALAYDAEAGVFFALSDDKGDVAARGPARLYTLRVDLGTLGAIPSPPANPEPPSVEVIGVTVLRDKSGAPYAPGSLDPEGLALTPSGTFLVSSEGDPAHGIAPFVREISRDGATLRSFDIPSAYLPGKKRGKPRGVRPNLAFEALTRTPSYSAVFAGIENALVQDGPKAVVGRGSPSRLLRFDPRDGRPVAEYRYLTEPVAAPALPPGGLEVAGLVELLALDERHLLALERSYSAGLGNAVRLFAVSLDGAGPIRAGKATSRRTRGKASKVRPVHKELLLDLADVGVPLDNLEGLAWGPKLPDGRRTLWLASDNNFSFPQVTQFLIFSVASEPALR